MSQRYISGHLNDRFLNYKNSKFYASNTKLHLLGFFLIFPEIMLLKR